MKAYFQISPGTDCAQRIQVDGCCQHTAVIVICMISADLRPAGCADQLYVLPVPEQFRVPADQSGVTFPLMIQQDFIIPVQIPEPGACLLRLQFPDFSLSITHCIFPLSVTGRPPARG